MSLTTQVFSRFNLIYPVLLTFLFIFFMVTYISGDDWSRVQTAELFRSGGRTLDFQPDIPSGRVLANLLATLSSFSFELNSLVRASTILGIVWSIVRITQIKVAAFIPLITIAVLVPSIPTLRQAIIFSEGFFTHVVPVLVVLMIVIVFRDFKGRWKGMALFSLSFAASLFVETVTLAVLLSALAFAVIAASKRRFRILSLWLISGSVLGTAVMLSNPVYRRIAEGVDTFREFGGGGDHNIFESGPLGLAQGLVLDLFPLHLMAAVVIIFFAMSSNRNRMVAVLAATTIAVSLFAGLVLDLRPLYLIAAVVMIFLFRCSIWDILVAALTATTMIISLFAVYAVLSPSNTTWPGISKSLLAVLVLVLYVFYLLISMVILLHSKEKSHRSAFLWLASGGLIAAPLLVVSPFGPRNFFITSIFVLLAILIISGPFINSFLRNRRGTVALAVLFGVLSSTLFGAIAANKLVSMSNLALAAELYRTGATKIELRNYPFDNLVHDGRNGDKFLRQLQFLECDKGVCTEIREVEVIFK